MRIIILFLNALLCIAAIHQQLTAQPITKDQSYGDGGRMLTSVYDYSDYSIRTSLCSDGSTLTCGFYIRDIARPYTGAGYVMKVRPNGMLDNRFGNSGFFRDTMLGTMSFGNAMELVDGRILVCGSAQLNSIGSVHYPILYRLLPNGRRDTLFGNAGKILFNNTPRVGMGDIRRLPDGNYIVSCSYYDGNAEFDVALMRLRSDGTPDSTYGTNGLQVFSNPILYDLVMGIDVQTDGKIIILGRQYMKYDQSVASLMRIRTDGSVDSSFGIHGRVIVRSPAGDGYCSMNAVLIQPDGRILVTGYAYAGDGSGIWYTNIFMIARFMPDGQPDTSFGTNGISMPDVASGEEHAVKSVVLRNGKIMVAGNVGAPFPNFQSYGGLVRLLPNGTVDSSFGVNGVVLEDLTGTEGQGVSDILLTSDEGILLCGHGYEDNWNGYFNLVMVKYMIQNATTVDEDNTSSFMAYPNPATTYLHISLPNDAEESTMKARLYDMLGSVAVESKSRVMSTKHLAAGQYLLRVEYQSAQGVKIMQQVVQILR